MRKTKSAVPRVCVERINAVLDELRDYWPLTLRQVFYRLVSAGDIKNDPKGNEYKRLSRMLTKARYDELVPWEAMEDRSRLALRRPSWWDKTDFIQESMDEFLSEYHRDPLQSQDRVLEVWLEKDALSRIVQRAAAPFGVLVVIARGFISTSFMDAVRRRIEARAEFGWPTRILYFGDLDPSGWEMPLDIERRLIDRMNLAGKVDIERCALTLGQVREYQLPHKPDALKVRDPRAREYVRRFGPLAVELDALSPPTLERLVRESIERNIDMEAYRAEVEAGKAEEPFIHNLRSRVAAVVGDVMGGAL